MSQAGPKTRHWVTLIAIVALVSLPAAATTKWVDQAAGSDANDGDTEATAYASLQFALDNSASGVAGTPSIINVKDGTYGVSGQLDQASHAAAIICDDLDYLTIQAVPGHNPVITPVTAAEADIVSLAVQDCDHLVVDNIDSDQTVAQWDNWHVYDSDDLTVRNSTFQGGEDGIDFNTSLTTALIERNVFRDINTGSGDEVLDFTDATYTDIVIQDNDFFNNYRQITINPPSANTASEFIIRRNLMDGTTSQEAIRLIGATEIAVVNNCILNSLQQGLYIDTSCANVNVWHNSFFNDGLEEIRTKVNSADISIMNNIMYANGTYAAIAASVSPHPGEDYNLVFNWGLSTDSGSQPAVTTFGANTLDGMDPDFVSTTGGSEDLHLQAGSPAIEAGTNLGVPDDNGQGPRPNPAGSDPDMGCFEFVMGACCTDGPGTNSDCVELTQDECASIGGLYQGDGSECANILDCVPLVVTIESIRAEAIAEGVLLSWTTATEIDTVGFRVLRQTTDRAKGMQVVSALISAAGNGTSGATYSFLDGSKQSASAVYYWVEDLDMYGKVTRHGPVEVQRGSRVRKASRR